MLLIQNALAGTNWPPHGQNYAARVREELGEAAGDQFRMFWTDHAAHAPASFYPPGPPPVVSTRVVDYGGLLHRAVADVIACVEQGVDPPSETRYQWSGDGRLTLAPTALERGGLQPVIDLRATGGQRAEIRVGHPLELELAADCPPGAGSVVAIEWDFEGTGDWSHRSKVPSGNITSIEFRATHTFSRAGVYFPTARVWSQREGDMTSRLYRTPNLSRIRVIVGD
jgi:hypothetical protein